MRHSKKDLPYIFHFLIALLTSYLVTTIGILILSLLLFKFHISIQYIDIGIIFIYTISNLIGGFCFGKKLEKRKYLGGLFIGILYFIITILLSLIIHQSFQGIHFHLFTSFLLCATSAMMGGCISSSQK